MWLFGMYIPQSTNRDHQEGQRSCLHKTEPHNTMYHLTYIPHILYSIQYLDTDISLIIWLFFSKKGICVRTDPIPTSANHGPNSEACAVHGGRMERTTGVQVPKRKTVTTRDHVVPSEKKNKLPKQQHVAGGSLSMD